MKYGGVEGFGWMNDGCCSVLQNKYKQAGKKELVKCLYSLLPETQETQHAKEQSQLHSEVRRRLSTSCQPAGASGTNSDTWMEGEDHGFVKGHDRKTLISLNVARDDFLRR